jgi:hypothetical protein
LNEKSLRPNLVEPWFGTGFELIVPRPVPPGSPAGTPPRKDQVFVVPSADGACAAGLRLNEGGQGATVAPEIRAWACSTEDGCVVAACIPWRLLGSDGMPESLPFELIVDVVKPRNDAIAQVEVFDLPWDGWQRLTGRLICG